MNHLAISPELHSSTEVHSQAYGTVGKCNLKNTVDCENRRHSPGFLYINSNNEITLERMKPNIKNGRLVIVANQWLPCDSMIHPSQI